MFLLVTPLSHRAWFVAYVGASVLRGLVVGAASVAAVSALALHLLKTGYKLRH